jgi:Zn-dependent M28 family amino/carboxypeptidase
MTSRFLLAAAPLLALVSTPILAQRQPAVTPEQMRRHIEVLASDEYEGREPGTPGETKTITYIAAQLQQLGLEPAAGNGSWYQSVGLVNRRPLNHRAIWTRKGKTLAFDQADIIFMSREPAAQLRDAPVVFVGHGAVAPDKNLNQLEGADLKGAVALLLFAPPSAAGFPSIEERVKAVRDAGAAAVITIIPEQMRWADISTYVRQGQDGLQSKEVSAISGTMPYAAASQLVAAMGGRARLLESAAEAGFKPVRLDARAAIDVSTEVRKYDSHNVIGRLRGTGNTGESVIYLGHWDHVGICRPEGAPDRICNGAVDNASGIAMLIEIAANIAKGKRPERDLIFMATTAEEMGLLGAEHFGANPPVPLKSLVAAINIDTVAIAKKGEPVAVIGRGNAALDKLIAATAAELGRTLDTDTEADSFVTRQDGWILTRAGVPTVMVGGSFANMKQLGAFLQGPYHKPEDDLKREIVLEGAAEDTDLLIMLGRKLADPNQYQPAER